MSRSEDYDDRRNRRAFPEDYADEGKTPRGHPAEAPAAFLEPSTPRKEPSMDLQITSTIKVDLSASQIKEMVQDKVVEALAAKGHSIPASANVQIEFQIGGGYEPGDASFGGCQVKITYTPERPTRGGR